MPRVNLAQSCYTAVQSTAALSLDNGPPLFPPSFLSEVRAGLGSRAL